MIVSASRRTDIPALYAGWLIDRLTAGFAEVANPFRADQVRRVDLRPAPEGDLEALVLWTRHPGPLAAALEAWETVGLRTVWNVTVTGYPPVLEPRVPPAGDAVDALRRVATLVGAERVAWRYDPVFLCPEAGVDAAWHRRNFRGLAERMAQAAGQCTLSLYDGYAKAARRFKEAGLRPQAGPDVEDLVGELARTARSFGIAPRSCCEELSRVGVEAGACVDGALLDRLWGLGVAGARDTGQRPGCRCAPSVDLGVYDTCSHGCLYCYATRWGARGREARPGEARLA